MRALILGLTAQLASGALRRSWEHREPAGALAKEMLASQHNNCNQAQVIEKCPSTVTKQPCSPPCSHLSPLEPLHRDTT